MDAITRYPRLNAYCRRLRQTLPDDLESFSLKDVPQAKHRAWLARYLRLRKEGKLDQWQQELIDGIGFNWTTGKVPKPPKPPRPPRAPKPRKPPPPRPPRKRTTSRASGDDPTQRIPAPGERPLSGWERNYEELRAELEGAREPFAALIEAEDYLFLWARRQLVALLKGKLSGEREAKLRGLFPGLSESDDLRGLGQWRSGWDNYRVVHGKSPFLADQPGDSGDPGESGETGPAKIDEARRMRASRWASRQRRLRRRGELAKWQIELLDGIGFRWDIRYRPKPGFDQWYARLDQLLELEARHGTPVPTQVLIETGLKSWISRVRRMYGKGELPPELVRTFKEKGFVFDGIAALRNRWDRDWARNYKKLLAFYRQFGHPRIPSSYSEDPELGGWLAHQRERMAKGVIKPDKRRALEELGVKTPVRRAERTRSPVNLSPWREVYKRLEKLAAGRPGGRFGSEFEIDPKARTWFKRQRWHYAEGRLEEWQVEALRRIGLDPGASPAVSPYARDIQKRWQADLERHRAFVAEKGHGYIPGTKEHKYLANFAARVRRRYRDGTLSEQQIQELRDVGFVFDPSGTPSANWMDHYATLKAYHAEHGNSAVPRRYKADIALAHFVAQQKQRGRTGKLYREQIRLLDELDFPWSGGRPIPRDP